MRIVCRRLILIESLALLVRAEIVMDPGQCQAVDGRVRVSGRVVYRLDPERGGNRTERGSEVSTERTWRWLLSEMEGK